MVETKPTLSKQNKILLFLMAVIFAIFFVSAPLNLLVNAESNRVTSVIEDLQSDPNFSVEDYPSITPTKPEDYKMQVIQIAETSAKELFIYVYQPTAITRELKATSINISQSIGENFAPKNYDLSFLNSRGVFQKYVVEDFYVKNDALRYYQIISIFRAFNENLDEKPDGEQTISERSYEVNQLWKTCTVNGEVTYTYEIKETIEVVDKFVGFVRYGVGEENYHNAFTTDYGLDRHFVAFSTDKKIDELMEADVEYQTQAVSLRWLAGGYLQSSNYSKPEKYTSYLTIDDNKKISVDVRTGLFTKRNFTYEWKNIQTVEEFKNSVNMTKMYKGAIFNTSVQTKINDEELKQLDNKQWVLTFDDTIYDNGTTGSLGVYPENYTAVSNVTILRLKFVSEGEPYNLGVVDNKQTGSGKPINTTTVTSEWGWLMEVLKCIGIVIIVSLIIKFVIIPIIELIKSIFK